MSALSNNQFVEVHRGFGRKNINIKQPLGMHWTSEPHIANRFADRGVPESPGDIDTSVIMHGKVASTDVVNPKSREGRDLVARFQIWPDSGEKEKTVRPGSTVLVTGQTRLKTRKDRGGHIEWKSRKRTYNPPRNMTA